jgi:signal transduction histidine kinase
VSILIGGEKVTQTVPSGPNRDAPSRRILVVDDDEDVRYLCAEALGKHEVFQAENGRVALGMQRQDPFDVILTDVKMPEMTGLDLLAAVKEKSPNQIVVVMTSFAEKKTVLKALKSQADDFIEKPIDMIQVRAVVDRALEKQRLREELFHLKQMDRLKSDFLGLISHKLKTPITIISLSTQILAEKAKEYGGDPSFERNLEATQEQTAYLVSLIEELLRFSDAILREERVQRERTDLEGLVRACVDKVRDAASRGQVDLELLFEDSLPPLEADRRRLEFALHAVLDNAVKFSPPGGRVTVTGRAGGTEVRLVVRDSGSGIEEEEQPKVFEKFYQVDPDYTGQVRGFGLGLFYARRFVEEHGGLLELESAPGEGTTVTIVLPLSIP